MDLPLDFKEILEEFAREGVEHLIVGGYAAALARFGAPDNVVSATRSMQDSDIVYLGQPPLRIALLRKIDGVETEDAFARAVAGRWNDLAIRVIGLDDLILNKQAAGRPQDLADVRLLQRVRSRSP
jgi:hypothetical protein